MFGHVRVKGEPQVANRNNCNIYIHIGDSNQGGPVLESSVGNWDNKYNSSDSIKLYYKDNRTSADDGEWQLYNTRSEPYHNRYPGLQATTLGVGPDQAFIYTLSQDTTIKKIKRYIKVAVGGSSLLAQGGVDNEWAPTSGELSELFAVFVKYFVKAGLSKLPLEGIRNPIFKGIIVRLGTNDCKTGAWNQANFASAVPAFCSAVRSYLGAPSVPIYWVQVRSDLGSASGFDATAVSQCRTILSDCQSGGATPISGFTLLNYDSDSIQADVIHFDVPAFLRQGEEEANAMIALGT